MEAKERGRRKYQYKGPLTLERLKTYKGLQGLTDKEAMDLLASLKTFASIVFNAYKAETKTK